jgi:hypothetical protein
MAARTADAGKPAARVAAIQVTLDDLLDNRAEEAVLLVLDRYFSPRDLTEQNIMSTIAYSSKISSL